MSSSDTEQLLDPAGVEDAVVAASSDAGEEIERGGFTRKLARWTTKGGLAILDQGLISGSNFVITILLGRWLLPEQYGAFSLAFSVFIVLSYVYQSLLSEPQGVFAGSAYRECLRGYLKALLGIQAVLTVFGLVLLGGSSAIVYALGKADGLPGALAGVAIASPCILFFWLMRRAYYMNLAPARAAVGAFIYCALVTGGLFVAYRRGLVSPFSAYLLMALGALGTGFFLLSQVNKALPPDTVKAPTAGQAWRKHWEYGRWALAVSLVTWIANYIWYPLVAAFSGMAQVGQMKALLNLSLPMEQTYMALSILFLPYAARICREKGIASSGLAGAADHAAVCGGRGCLLGGADSVQGVCVSAAIRREVHRGGALRSVCGVGIHSVGRVVWTGDSAARHRVARLHFLCPRRGQRLVADSRSSGHVGVRSLGRSGEHYCGQFRGHADFNVHPVSQVALDFTTESGSVRGKLDMNPLKQLRFKASRTKLRLPQAWWQHRGLNDKDVLFASFERSGNTWLRFVLMEILTKDNAGFLNVNHILPEMGTHRESKPVLPNGGRLIKTHEQYRSEYKRAIYLMRDLRDVMLSNWARDKEMGFSQYFDNGQGMDGYIESFVQGKVTRFGSWQSHVDSWLNCPLAQNGNLLVVRYEDLRRDTETGLIEMLEFLGHPGRSRTGPPRGRKQFSAGHAREGRKGQEIGSRAGQGNFVPQA